MRVAWQQTHRALFIRWCSLLCFLVGGIAVGSCVFLSAEAHIYQHLESRHFDSPVRTVSPEKASACESISVDQGTAIGRLEISRVGISVVVLEGDDAHTLRLGAGRVPGTAWPGHGGNVAIAAHRDTFFRGLRDVRKDDRIRLLTTANEYVYRVESTLIVNPTQVEVLDPTSQPTLTLITCYPFHYIGDAPDRFIVRALQISSLRRSSTECPGTRSR
jgi:sortase A